MARRIGILMTTVDPSDFAKRHLDDGQKFRKLLGPLRPDWVFEVFAVRDDRFPAAPRDFDGFLITGSPASVQDGYPWIPRLKALVRDLAGHRVPLVGICFGHQLIAEALGGAVSRNPGGWSLGMETTGFWDHRPWMVPPVQQMQLYSAHSEQVTALPKGAVVLGGNAACPIGAFAIGDHIFTTEYHPEMYADFMAGLAEELAGKLPPEVIERARDQAGLATDGTVFGEWIVRFFEATLQTATPAQSRG